MKERIKFIVGFFFISAILFNLPMYSESVTWEGITYDDETTANLITVITTTNPIPSIPRLKHLRSCQKNLHRIPALAKCKKIIVFDGVQPEYEHRRNDYEDYKKRVQRQVDVNPYFANTKLVFCSEWVHLSGAIREALKHVDTPYIFVQQHDFDIIKMFDLNGIIASMAANPYIKHVKIEYNATNDSANWWNGPVDEVVDGIHFVPLTRTFGWSDVTHVSTVEYYRDFVLPKCKHGPMEHFLHNPLKKDLEDEGLIAHQKYGTYLYGKIKDGGYICHTDGRNSF